MQYRARSGKLYGKVYPRQKNQKRGGSGVTLCVTPVSLRLGHSAGLKAPGFHSRPRSRFATPPYGETGAGTAWALDLREALIQRPLYFLVVLSLL